MSLLRSLLYDLKEARCNPVTLTHQTLYAATQTYLKVLDRLLLFNVPWFKNHMVETYHGKVVRVQEAEKIIRVDRKIELRNLEQVLPYKHARDLVLRNPQNVLAYECACRAQKKDPCRPTDVCLVVGEPLADLLRVLQPLRTRRISADEAVQIIKDEDDRGHMHSAWFKTATLDRFYAICNCCKCCCLGMKFFLQYKMKALVPSGFVSVIGPDCKGCGNCARNCQFGAIEMQAAVEDGQERRRAVRDWDRCYGCGVCESKCKSGNITVVPDARKGVPLDIDALERTRLTQ
ncbi:MAG: 4Fe-4S dicluster domain-containing protein [Deltaproteobacteria bacterium]|nr:4Fe-4S dicluster domain-containing protein [Deltaproteobacteria bacterium]